MNLKKLMKQQKFNKKANGIIWGIIIFLCLLSIAGTIAFFVLNGIPVDKQQEWMKVFRQYWLSFVAFINGIQAPLIIIKIFTTANQLAIQYKMRKVIGEEEKKMISFKQKKLARAVKNQHNKKAKGKNLALYNEIKTTLQLAGYIFTEEQCIEIVSMFYKKLSLVSISEKIYLFTKKRLDYETYNSIISKVEN